MKFSERYGYADINRELQRGYIGDSLKTRLWNVFYETIVSKVEWPLDDEETYNFLERCWDSIFKHSVRSFRRNRKNSEVAQVVSKTFRHELKWYKIFDLIELSVKEFNKQDLKEKYNNVLREEGSAYRIINNQIIEIVSEEEVKEIEKVFNQSDKFEPIKKHLEKSLRYLSNREKPDYENSIKESISSLESLAKILTEKNLTLGILIKDLDIHPALKESISKLYGWASNEDGIRHGSNGKTSKIDEQEARLVLVIASSLINYIIARN